MTGNEELVARAKQSLHALDIVGFLDDLPAFADAVHDRTGAWLAIGRENRSPTQQTEELLRHPLMERVLEYCAVDHEIHAYARREFGPSGAQNA